MDWSALPVIILRLAVLLAVLLAGLLVPGSLLLRALRLPWSLAAAFVGSTALLYVTVLVFAWTSAPISLATLAATLALISILTRAVPTRPSATQLSPSLAMFTRMGPWLPLYLAFWAIVIYRLIFQPLNGPDVYFRWSWLAEQMLATGSLDFYPARSAGDFVRYFWAESIPPGIASLYAWAYACGGSKHAWWTSPVVMLQLLSLHEIIWRLANRWGGEVVARRAVLFAAACPLLTWSFLIGQESGLLALAVAGLVWSFHHFRDADGHRWIVLGGIFALVAASTREYGAAFAVVAIAATVAMRLPRRQTWLLAAITVPVIVAWPLRVWLLTGNPFYSLNVAGLFPTNPIFIAWNDAFRGPHGFALASADNWQALARYLLLWGLPAVVGLIALLALLVQRLREARIVALFVLLSAALWFASMAYTAGGLFYSLRVLSPAFALLAFVASYGLGFFGQNRTAQKLTAVIVVFVVLESLPKTLVLPENPYRISASAWPEAAQQFPAMVRAGEQALVAKLEPLPQRQRILSDDAGMPRAFAAIGTEVAPLWSPEVAWLFDPKLPAGEVAARWQKSGLRYLVLGKSGPTATFMQTRAQWRAPYFTLSTVAETNTHIILEATVPTAPALP